MRLLGMDYGRKRIGIALSDPLRITAQPFGYISQGPKAMDEIVRIIQEKEVQELVVGYPRSLNGTPGPMAQEVEKFVQTIREKVSIPIHFWDEQFTSAQAERVLLEGEVRRSRRKELQDSIAASFILQSYLEHLSHT